MFSGSVRTTCPKCKSRNVRRSKRKGFWERDVLQHVGVRPYRCNNCDQRFFRFGNHAGHSGGEATLAQQH